MGLTIRNNELARENLRQAEHVITISTKMQSDLLVSVVLSEQTNESMKAQIELSNSLTSGLDTLESKLSSSHLKLNGFLEIITSKIDHLQKLQAMLLTHTLDFTIIALYLLAFTCTWFLTSFKTMRDARFRLILTITCSYFVERFISFPYGV